MTHRRFLLVVALVSVVVLLAINLWIREASLDTFGAIAEIGPVVLIYAALITLIAHWLRKDWRSGIVKGILLIIAVPVVLFVAVYLLFLISGTPWR